MFYLYIKSDKRMVMREFMGSLGAILRNPETLDITQLKISTHQTQPFGIISIDHLGNFSTFSPELLGQHAPDYNNFVLGNVYNSGFLKPEKKELLAKLKKEISKGISKCEEECGYFSICGGGAPANKFYENKSFDSTLTKFCQYHIQIPADITLSYIENTLGLI